MGLFLVSTDFDGFPGTSVDFMDFYGFSLILVKSHLLVGTCTLWSLMVVLGPKYVAKTRFCG